MRAVYVDERNSTWERDDARYRIFVFKGTDNAVTATDLTDATVEEAVEAAQALSEKDAHLWSLALIEDDARGLPGLLWLSGMDYNDPPDTPQGWRRRRQMQDRYLMAKSRAGQPLLLPNGLRLIRMFPEWVSGWPLWESFTEQYRLEAQDLGLTSALGRDLYDWNEVWLMTSEEDPTPAEWLKRGQQLFQQLKVELAGRAEVRPEFLQ